MADDRAADDYSASGRFLPKCNGRAVDRQPLRGDNSLRVGSSVCPSERAVFLRSTGDPRPA